MSENLEYWGTSLGKVVKAIAVDGAKSWSEINEVTGLHPKSQNKALAILLKKTDLEKQEDNEGEKSIYRVKFELYKKYKEYFKSINKSSEQNNRKITADDHNRIIDKIKKYAEYNNLEFDLDKNQLYLTQKPLADLSYELIQEASKEIFIINPFISKTNFSNLLISKTNDGVITNIITREPKDDDFSKEDKNNLLKAFQEASVNLYIMKEIHAKIVLVDRAAAVISSMNLYPNSLTGGTWEAGLVTFEEGIVDSIFSSIEALLDGLK